MRAIVHIGTHGCATALGDALREHLDPVVVLVPAEPALLGPTLGTGELEGELVLLARLVLARAIDQAQAAREQAVEELASVFDTEPRTEAQAVTGHVVESPLTQRLPEVLGEHEVQEVWMSREALELLDQAQADVAQAISAGGAELEAR